VKYGLYISASGVMSNMYRQDVFSNNLANVQTIAYKPDVPAMTQRDPETIEAGLSGDLSNELLEQLGGGVFAGPQRINFTPGTLQATGNALDAALSDKHSFFVVDHTDPGTGSVASFLTRDGRFTTDTQGRLLTRGGAVVQGDGGGAITIPPGGELNITEDGTILRNGVAVGRLRVAQVNEPDKLEKRGQNRFAIPRGVSLRDVDNPKVRGGFVEGSGVDAISALMNIVNATKAATGNARMIQYHAQLLDRAVNTLGRVV